MLTIEEAILHCEGRAKADCSECADEHRQLAEWLKELRALRKNWIPVEERMPEETQVSEFPSMKPLHKVSAECLVTFRTEKNLYVSFDNTVDGEWIQSDNVIAWMPKPEPYNPQN